MPPADTPDFDSMSPEEVMAWMESLAKRQGASSEGFTTSADMEIAEVDPDSVQIDEPGYVPYGEESKVSKELKAAQSAPELEPEPPALEPELEPEPDEEALELETGGMEWLESLAADQAGGLPEMDLAALSAAIEETEEAEEPEPAPANPMEWLENLAESQGEFGEIDAEAEEPQAAAPADAGIDLRGVEDPLAAGIDPMLWLESLAKRQGASADELTTAADMDVPTPENAVDTGPGYTDFSIEGESSASATEPAKAEETVDPAAWVDSMATGAELEVEATGGMSDSDIEQALSSGQDIPPDQMEQFFARQLDRGLSREDMPPEPEEEFDPDAPPVPAELPDWLLEQVQAPDEVEAATPPADDEPTPEPAQPALVDEIMEPPSVEDLPDWLQEDTSSTDDLSLESIFESTETEAVSEEVEYDSSDPWVQAFEEEAATDPDEVPEWYERNLRDPDRIASVEGQADGESETLEEASLPPETSLPAGEPEAVPVWVGDEPEAAPAEEMPDWLAEAAPATSDDSDMPDWLADAEVDVSPEEIPDWLRDTVELEDTGDETIIFPAAEQPAVVTPPQPAPAPESAPAAPVSPVPAPPVPVAEIGAALTTARERAGSGDLDGSLQEYERVIRANTALAEVVGDLTQLAEQHKENPAVYRLLGDGLMRQGKLQAALDSYRKALNQL